MEESPTANPAALGMIRHFESLLKVDPQDPDLIHAYPDPAHGWACATIGWGTIRYPDGREVARGDTISREEADKLLAWEADQKAAGVASLVTVDINSNQFAALVSFAYNLGLGNLKKSTLLRKLNQGDYYGASQEFQRWNKAGGKVFKGLTRRRLSERNLFNGYPEPIIRNL